MEKAQVSLTMDLGLLDMHVEAKSAIVELRNTYVNQIANVLFNRIFFR